MSTLNTILDSAKVIDTATETVVLPTYNSLVIPKSPEYINGRRCNVNSYGTVDLSTFNGSTEQLIKEIGADFTAIKTPAMRKLSSGAIEEVPNDFYLINNQTDEVIGRHMTDRYSILQFDDSVYYMMSLLEEIEKHGFKVTPAYGKVWNGGSKMFLQYKIGADKIKGEPVDNYLSLISSHDGSCSFTMTLSTIRLFCSNQIGRNLAGARNRVTLKHTTSASSRIAQVAEKMIALEKKQMSALEAYADTLCKIKITEKDIFDAYAQMMDLEHMDTQRRADNFASRCADLISCYRAPDLADFSGTAYGAYLAYSDFSQHCVPLRKTADQKFIEAGLNGNEELGSFADILQALKF